MTFGGKIVTELQKNPKKSKISNNKKVIIINYPTDVFDFFSDVKF